MGNMNDGETKNPARSESKALVGVVIFVVVAFVLWWGYLRGMFGKASIAIQGVDQLAPQVEERNRLVRELADQPKNAEPK